MALADTLAAPFIWGSGGRAMTPEEIARERAMADALRTQAGDTSPVGHWTQGAARVVNALGGVLADRRASAGASANAETNKGLVSALMSGLSAPSFGQGASSGSPASNPAPVASPPTEASPLTAYLGRIRSAESGGDDAAKNPNSSATGRYQFTDATWRDVAANNPALGLTPDGRLDPAQQERAIEALTKSNASALQQAKIPITGGSLYGAHFLGSGGAKSVYSADPSTSMANLVSPEVMKANGFLNGMTAGDFQQWAASKGGNEAINLNPANDRVSAAFGDSQSAAGGTDWLKYANQGATRNKPLDDDLVNRLGYLNDLGVQMEVFSGGQDGKGEGNRRTGSTRHDHGNAADAFFYKDGRKLDWANPEDRPIFEEIVRRGKANGITGFGAGDGYMRSGSMHIGMGNPGVWGAGGKGANAADWLTNAYNGEGPSPAQQAIAQSLGQPEAAPQPDPLYPMAGATGNMQRIADALYPAAPTSVASQPQGGINPAILDALSNPAADSNTRGLATALLNRQFDQQDMQRKAAMEAADPMRQMQMEKARLELDAMKNPQPKYDFVTGKDGSIFRTDSAGGMQQVYGGKPDLPTNVQEYEYARQQGYQGTFQDFQLEGKKAGASQVNIDQKAEGAFDKKLAEGQAAVFNDLASEGMNARADLGVIGELEEVLGNNGGMLTGISGWLAQKGIGGEGMSDLQAADALINRLIPTQRQAGSGSMSDRDVEMFRRSLPSLWNQPGGNQKIIQTMRGLAEYRQAQGDIAAQVQDETLSRQEATKMLRALPNPLANSGSQRSQSQPAKRYASSAAVASPKSKAEFDAMPSGTRFRAPDGSMRVKP